MKLIHTIFFFEKEIVTTSITIWKFGAVSGDCMKWLMNVTGVVNQESEVQGVTKCPGDAFILILVLELKVVSHVVYRPGDIEILGKHSAVEALVEEWLIDEMPWGLGTKSLIFEIISESCTLYKHVLILMLVHISERLEESLSFRNNLWGSLH